MAAKKHALKPRVPVLLYHRVDTDTDPERRPFCVRPEAFREQMRWLAERGYQTISLEQLRNYYLHDAEVPRKAIVITFDDGYYCNYSRAFPMLQEFGFTATIFLLAKSIREPGSTKEGWNRFLSWPEIFEMRQAGFEFGSHGCTHRPLTQLSLAEAGKEIGESKRILEEHLREEVKFYCYPFAQYNAEIKKLVADHGYVGACGGPPFWEGGPRDWYEIGRTEILYNDSLRHFAFKVKFGLSYYYFARRQLGNIKRKLRAPIPGTGSV